MTLKYIKLLSTPIFNVERMIPSALIKNSYLGKDECNEIFEEGHSVKWFQAVSFFSFNFQLMLLSETSH